MAATVLTPAHVLRPMPALPRSVTGAGAAARANGGAHGGAPPRGWRRRRRRRARGSRRARLPALGPPATAGSTGGAVAARPQRPPRPGTVDAGCVMCRMRYKFSKLIPHVAAGEPGAESSLSRWRPARRGG